ncbi:unnamed protein product [Cyclocybe aegerita]|uniref:Protein kinase domain-containing protein n=1 Tax=Cyclocybe aegerita TaxID=1973307 RepID=A0A8S0X0Q1_CYCAE|nr:unnamed protein product [Cyclocybe aegerita]
MRTICHFFSLRYLAILLVSISASTTAYVIPLQLDYTALDRRATRASKTINIDGNVAELGEQLSPPDHGKSTVWRLKNWNGKASPGYVLKETAVKQPRSAMKVLVMKEVRGKMLAKMAEDLTPDREKWKRFMSEWKPKVAAAAAAIAKSKNMYHMDLNMSNIVVDGSKIQFIDWELYWDRGQAGFTDDKEKIERDLQTVWDTPNKFPKSNSPSASVPRSQGLQSVEALIVGRSSIIEGSVLFMTRLITSIETFDGDLYFAT